MDNFQAIGGLVTEARNLLDSIKGGAIRAMQNQFEALKQVFDENGNAAIQKIKSDGKTAIAQISTSQAMLNSIGFTALNVNDDFSLWTTLTNSRGESQEWPVATAFYNDATPHAKELLTPSKIKVVSGVKVSDRPAIVQELIQFAGFGGVNFPRGGFTILKLTATGSSAGKVIDLGFAGYTVESAGGLTYMAYVRTPRTNNQWERQRAVFGRHIDGFGYTFPSSRFAFEPGDEIYIALPTLTAGEFPAGVMHGLLPNEPRARYKATK